MSVTDRFQLFLHLSDEDLKTVVDLYNAGTLPPLSCIALEAIEAAYDEDLVKRS